MTKVCTKCKEEKEIENNFSVHKSGPRKGKIGSECKLCRNKRLRGYRKRNPDLIREIDRKARYKYRYGLSPEDIITNGSCCICGQINKKLVADHCHSSGLFRDFICYSCNTLLGSIENPDKLSHIISYLDKHNSPVMIYFSP